MNAAETIFFMIASVLTLISGNLFYDSLKLILEHKTIESEAVLIYLKWLRFEAKINLFCSILFFYSCLELTRNDRIFDNSILFFTDLPLSILMIYDFFLFTNNKKSRHEFDSFYERLDKRKKGIKYYALSYLKSIVIQKFFKRM